MPADDLLEVPDGPMTVTLSAHGWVAAVRGLSVGEHSIIGGYLTTDGEHDMTEHVL